MNMAPRTAELVVINGRLFNAQSRWENQGAVAIEKERIVFVGSSDDIRSWVTKNTQVINARGNSILPGFIDSHVHFSSGGLGLSGIQLRDAATPDEFVRRIYEYTRNVKPGEWICGGRWNHELWSGSFLPSKDWIDRGTLNNPMLVYRYDGHMSLANSIALKLAGITSETESPTGGLIEKDMNGEPTGILKDEAISLVQKIIPQPTEEQLLRGIKAALAEARRFGVTGIHDNARPIEFSVYKKLYECGEMTCRVYCLTPMRFWKSISDQSLRTAFANDWLRTGALKGFADGSLGSSTALFFEPYADNPQNSGLLAAEMLSQEKMLKLMCDADRAGLQICIHAIGDKANNIVLGMYESVAKKNGVAPEKRRFRIEHAQHLKATEIPRFALLGVIASMQPYHLFDDGNWAEKRIGKERCRTTYAFKSLLNNRVRLAFGSDWPVVPLNPLLGIYAAVTRKTSDGKHPQGWFPQEKISLKQAISAYTSGSAYAEFSENEKGSLTAGKLADLVVLDADLKEIPPEGLKEARVLYTIVGGKVIYQNDH
jgi:predicted amidohydrolase YtcJ